MLFLKDINTLLYGKGRKRKRHKWSLSHSVSPQQSWRPCVQDKGLQSTLRVKLRDDWKYCPLTFNRLSNLNQAFPSRTLLSFSPYPELFTQNKSSLNKCSEFIFMNTLQNLKKLFEINKRQRHHLNNLQVHFVYGLYENGYWTMKWWKRLGFSILFIGKNTELAQQKTWHCLNVYLQNGFVTK